MRFLLDHDVPEEIEFTLAALGHEVLKVRHVLSRSAKDVEIANFAKAQVCVMLTCNRDDFLALYQSGEHAGLVVLVRRRTRAQERAALVRCLDQCGESGIANNINFA